MPKCPYCNNWITECKECDKSFIFRRSPPKKKLLCDRGMHYCNYPCWEKHKVKELWGEAKRVTKNVTPKLEIKRL